MDEKMAESNPFPKLPREGTIRRKVLDTLRAAPGGMSYGALIDVWHGEQKRLRPNEGSCAYPGWEWGKRYISMGLYRLLDKHAHKTGKAGSRAPWVYGPRPKYKVGDRVRHKGPNFKGVLGTIDGRLGQSPIHGWIGGRGWLWPVTWDAGCGFSMTTESDADIEPAEMPIVPKDMVLHGPEVIMPSEPRKPLDPDDRPQNIPKWEESDGTRQLRLRLEASIADDKLNSWCREKIASFDRATLSFLAKAIAERLCQLQDAAVEGMGDDA